MKFSRAIMSGYTYLPRAEINVDRYIKALTAKNKYEPEKVVEMFDNSQKDWFGVPRYFLAGASASIVEDKRSEGRPIHITSTTRLWGYQQKALDEFNKKIKEKFTGIFLEADPGAGKTIMGIKMICDLNKTALIVVPKKDLVEQWKARLLSNTTIREEDIGVCSNGKCDWREKKIVIGVVHTLAKDREGETFRSKFGTILFDECDSSVPPKTFAPVAAMFSAKYRIGMTASATRADLLHIVFENHIKEAHIKCSNTNTMIPKGYMVQYGKSSGYISPKSKGIPRRGMLISHLASNQDRNEKLAEYVLWAFKEGHHTLVISDRKEQLMELEKILYDFGINKGVIGYYCASMDGKIFKKKELDAVAKNCRIILGTYGMIGRGTDIQRLSCLVLASPRSDMRQIKGRIERFLAGKKEPVIIDFVDTAYKDCISAARQRIDCYSEKNMKVYQI